MRSKGEIRNYGYMLIAGFDDRNIPPPKKKKRRGNYFKTLQRNLTNRWHCTKLIDANKLRTSGKNNCGNKFLGDESAGEQFAMYSSVEDESARFYCAVFRVAYNQKV